MFIIASGTLVLVGILGVVLGADMSAAKACDQTQPGFTSTNCHPNKLMTKKTVGFMCVVCAVFSLIASVIICFGGYFSKSAAAALV